MKSQPPLSPGPTAQPRDHRRRSPPGSGRRRAEPAHHHHGTAVRRRDHGAGPASVAGYQGVEPPPPINMPDFDVWGEIKNGRSVERRTSGESADLERSGKPGRLVFKPMPIVDLQMKTRGGPSRRAFLKYLVWGRVLAPVSGAGGSRAAGPSRRGQRSRAPAPR